MTRLGAPMTFRIAGYVHRLDKRIHSFTVALNETQVDQFHTDHYPHCTGVWDGDGEPVSIPFLTADRVAMAGWELVRERHRLPTAVEYLITLSPVSALPQEVSA